MLLAKTYLMKKCIVTRPRSILVKTLGYSDSPASIPHGRLLGILEAGPFVACRIEEGDLSENLNGCLFSRENDDVDDISALLHQLIN